MLIKILIGIMLGLVIGLLVLTPDNVKFIGLVSLMATNLFGLKIVQVKYAA